MSCEETESSTNLPQTWQTRDGTIVSINVMTTNHIINSINMIRRRYKEDIRAIALQRAYQAFHYAYSAPDGAADAASEYGNLMLSDSGIDTLLEEKLPIVLALKLELHRRSNAVASL